MPDSLADEIYRLETELLRPEVRHSAEELDALLDDGFVEFGSSGRAWDKRRVVEALLGEQTARIEVEDFRVRPLGENAALATYRSRRPDGAVSLRSSVWLRKDGEWKLAFHQGTPVVN